MVDHLAKLTMTDVDVLDPSSAGDASPDGAPSDGVGLCLSGGGYRAMLFHAGALVRMNEAGLLGRLDRVSSVSGGSIAAGALGLAWSRLAWDAGGVATNLGDLVTTPLVDLAGHTVDVPSVLLGVWPGRIAGAAASRLRRRLFGDATLQSLPKDGDGPRFVITATNLSNGTLWRFSRPYMRDYLTPEIQEPTVPLADAVTASAAFPPVLSPFVLHPRRFADGVDPSVPERVVLTDGGVYDNLGVEPVWKRCATVFVSDGGGPFEILAKPRKDWLSGTVRLLKVVDVQVRRLRRHQVIDGLEQGRRKGAYWGISSLREDFAAPVSLRWTDEATNRLALIPTRLGRMPRSTRHRLVNWGYAAADAALRTYYDPAIPAATVYPFPKEGVG